MVKYLKPAGPRYSDLPTDMHGYPILQVREIVARCGVCGKDLYAYSEAKQHCGKMMRISDQTGPLGNYYRPANECPLWDPHWLAEVGFVPDVEPPPKTVEELFGRLSAP